MGKFSKPLKARLLQTAKKLVMQFTEANVGGVGKSVNKDSESVEKTGRACEPGRGDNSELFSAAIRLQESNPELRVLKEWLEYEAIENLIVIADGESKQRLVSELQEHKLYSHASNVVKRSLARRKVLNKFPGVYIADGVLLKEPVRRDLEPAFVPPKLERTAIMKEAHEGIMGAHCGVFRTYTSVRLGYWWPG